MAIIILVSEETHFRALRAARQVGREYPTTSEGANALLASRVREAAEKVWKLCESAVLKACTDGMESARQVIDSAVAAFNQVAGEVEGRVKELNSILIDRLNEYFRNAVDDALRGIRHSLDLGEKHVVFQSVTIEHTIKLGGSLKASLTEACQLVAEGAVSLAVEYAEISVPA